MVTAAELDEGLSIGVARVADLARRHADVLATSDRLPTEVVDASLAAGLYRLCLPSELGGAAISLPHAVSIIETLSHADGSVGWCTMVANMGASLLAGMDEDQARLVAAQPDRLCIAGGFPPLGRATQTDGSYILTGRWGFASGCTTATWFIGGAMVEPADGEDGAPRPLIAFFPADQGQINPNWDVIGLRATGSHDITANAVPVPIDRTSTLSGPRWSADRLAALSFFAIGVPLLAAVPLGIAERAIDELIEHAASKVHRGQSRPVVEDEGFQDRFAAVVGRLRAARSYLFYEAQELWNATAAGPVAGPAAAGAFLAAAEVGEAATAAALFAHEALGTSSIPLGGTMARCLSDILVATRHVALGPAARRGAGRTLLGLPPEGPLAI